MAADQGEVCKVDSKRRVTERRPAGSRGTRHLATPFLGASDQGRGRHIEYCYINPVKHGLVTCVRDWPYSSFHRDVRAKLFPQDWAGDVSAEGEFGERF